MDSDFGPIRKIREIRGFGLVFAVLSGFGAILGHFFGHFLPGEALGASFRFIPRKRRQRSQAFPANSSPNGALFAPLAPIA